jgi:hypothetical protein
MKLKSIVQHSLRGFVLLCQCAILLEHFHFYSVQKASQAQGLNNMVSRDAPLQACSMALILLETSKARISRRYITSCTLAPVVQPADQHRGNLAPRKYGKAHGIGHSATNVDQAGHIPRVVFLPRRMMVRDYGLKVPRQFPVRNEMPSCITMIKSEQVPLARENTAGRSAVGHPSWCSVR